jgi:hypothetical protein
MPQKLSLLNVRLIMEFTFEESGDDESVQHDRDACEHNRGGVAYSLSYQGKMAWSIQGGSKTATGQPLCGVAIAGHRGAGHGRP